MSRGRGGDASWLLPEASEPHQLSSCKALRYPWGPFTAGPLPSTPHCPPGWQRRRWPLALRVPAPAPLRAQQRRAPHMRVVTPCLARPGQTRAVSFPGGTCSLQQGWGGSHTFRLPHRKGPGRGGGDPGRGTFSWTSLTSHSGNLRRAAGAQAPLNAPFPASAPPPPMALQTPSVPCVTWMCRGLSGMTPGLGGWGRFASN